ncbi:hypothetical protein QR680_018098 [Steinernema hermaphroditum]|uniref:V-SNARE coiled-coil homology domain-containing protein n=1 Tax=Steinernema hermaphroditum TaxID=289476 RepID=A0AA39HHM9_9BILA|nr:hypothetical protein QR680_018098 [Steinernema hermaphroditum]
MNVEMNVQQPNRMTELQRQVNDIKTAKSTNVERILERGERLEKLDHRTEQLSHSAEGFKTSARRKNLQWKTTKGLAAETPRPKFPTFSVFTDAQPQPTEEQQEEQEDFGPVEKMGKADSDFGYFEPDVPILDPEFESIVLKDDEEHQPNESDVFERFKLDPLCESEEFDLEAFNREYADVLESLVFD